MVATRSLQLTVKKTTRQLKTLEGQLLMIKNGERTAISSRVAELDQIMPQYLGVSKAVLDSVIFCHQDESLWPMSEPSVLKKRFDEIFEAMKYTKAIDNIKALRKKQNEELAKYKIMEQHAKEDKDKADRAEKRSIQLQEEIEALREQTTQLSEEMREAADAADKAWKESASYAEILGKLDGKRIEARSKRSMIDDIEEHLIECDESDDWLESTLAQFESRLDQYREQEDSKKEKYMELRDMVNDKRQALGRKQTECGKLENDKAQYERQLSRREAMTREMANRHNIHGFDDELDEGMVNEFLNRMRRLQKEQSQALERAKREAQVELREAQLLLNQLSQKRATLQESKIAAKNQITSNDHEASTYQSKLNQIDVDEGSKVSLESKIAEIEERLQTIRNEAASASWQNGIDEANLELQRLEDTSSRLNTELIQGTRRAGDLARLDHVKKELKDRQRSLETMTGAHDDRIKKLIKSDWEANSLERDYEQVLQDRSNDLALAERGRDGVSRQMEQFDYKLKTTRQELKAKEAEVKECASQIRKAIDGDPEDYADRVQQQETDLDEAREHAESQTAFGDYFKMCLEALEKKKVCRTCSRGFKNDGEARSLKNKLENLIKKAQVDADRDTVAALEQDLKVTREAGKFYNSWERLTNSEIPALKKQESELQTRREELVAELEQHDKTVSDKSEVKSDLETLSKTVATIGKYDGEIRLYERQIDELSSQQSSAGMMRTLEDIQEELNNIAEQSRAVKKTVAKLTNEKEQSRNEMGTLELELRDVKNKLDNVGHQLDKKASLIARVEEYRRLSHQQREIMARADKEIESLGPELNKAQMRYDDVNERALKKESDLQKEATALSDNVRQLAAANDDIKSYHERAGPEQLGRAQRELKNIQDEITSLEQEQGQITVEINKISAQVKDSENTKRQYNDNLRYRREKRSLEQVDRDIRELEAQNAEVDRSRFKKESERWTNKHNMLAAEQASKMGEMKSKDDQLLQLIKDWDTDYKDAAQNFKETHIKVETTKAAVEDLGRYGGALDKAIMKYHSLKMGEINRIIEELWQRTYQGTDVDTILIRSDNENAKGNRSYNYRVCMVKQDAEMDMRGRCSAGQKVLASIIIRLALAECFGVNCGLIALDEPTTNLDRDNIRSLATSLHDIIRTRRQQSNFQLIVITHDEEFLRHMQCADFCDYYYRVSRNERQKSIIERQSIAEVM